MTNGWTLSVALLLGSVCSGCGSIYSRTLLSYNSSSVVYHGVVIDFEYLAVCEDPAGWTFGVLDLVPTLVLDTVLLPIDLVVWPFGSWDGLWGTYFVRVLKH